MSSENPQTRERILQATVDLLEAGGGRGVRMSDIAKQAGITRQALYLHFKTRAELLIAATFFVDALRMGQDRLTPSRTAKTGVERLDAFIEAWAGYLPEIYAMGRALIAMSDTDEAAAQAWNQRMRDMREGCEAAIAALKRDKDLAPGWTVDSATDFLWTLLALRNWEQLTKECGWSERAYADAMRRSARRIFVKKADPRG